jgi:hypothetical protein
VTRQSLGCPNAANRRAVALRNRAWRLLRSPAARRRRRKVRDRRGRLRFPAHRNARERFGEHPGLRYALVDINGELPGQALLAGKADVVIATNVVHNAHPGGR